MNEMTNQYKLTFTKVTRNKRIVQDWEYHIFEDINACLKWLRRDLLVSCMPFFDIERVNNKLIKVFYNDKLMGDIEYYVEIKRVKLDINRQIKRYKQKGFNEIESKGIYNLTSLFPNGA